MVVGEASCDGGGWKKAGGWANSEGQGEEFNWNSLLGSVHVPSIRLEYSRSVGTQRFA